MKNKLFWSAVVLACLVLPVPARAEQAGGAMAGDSATVGQYLNFAGIETKVENWGVVTTPTKQQLSRAHYFGTLKAFNADGDVLIQINLLFKNAGKKPFKLYTGDVSGTIVSKDEQSFNIDPHFLAKYGTAGSFSETLLPGQPVRGTIYVKAAARIVPAKLVLRHRREPDRVVRYFLQQNLPEELIPGTTRVTEKESPAQEPAAAEESPAVAAPEEEREPTIVDEIKDEAADTAKSTVKRQVRNKTKREIEKLIRF